MVDHYYSAKPESNFSPYKLRMDILGNKFVLYSAKGIFSKDELDFASKLLIETAAKKIQENSLVLDIGCGYGAVGIALLLAKPGVSITFSDVNERAVDLTKMNLDALGLRGKVIKSDLYENVWEEFDFILSNPPYAAGRQVCYGIIEGAKQRLKIGGFLLLVARHNKGGSMLKAKMSEVFLNVEDAVMKSGFRVYISERKGLSKW